MAPVFEQNNSEIEFTLVETDADLTKVVAAHINAPYLAVDTEFVRVDSYYPRVGLIQIGFEGRVSLIDPVKVTNLELLKPLFYGENSPLLVFHSCSEDIEVFKRVWGQVPPRVFDTQVGAGFLSEDRQPGLQRMVLAYLGVDLPKEETRSDWLARPLTPNQLLYAAMDVFYLEQIYSQMLDQLKQIGRLSWVEEECQQIINGYQQEVVPSECYKKVGDAWKLDEVSLHRLKALATWRETYAMEHDIARNFIANDATLFAIAKQPPQSIAELKALPNLKPVQVRKYGELLLSVVKNYNNGDTMPPELLEKPFSKRVKKLSKSLKEVVEQEAALLGLSPERVASRKLIERLIDSVLHNKELPYPFTGWRSVSLLPKLLTSLNGLVDD